MACENADSRPSFYVAIEPKPDVALYATDVSEEEPVNRGDAETCPVCGKYTSMLRWLPPFRVALVTWGCGYPDFARPPGDNILVSERFRKACEESSLAGFQDVKPIDIVKVVHRGSALGDPPPYYLVRVPRVRAGVDLNRSQILWKQDDPVCLECRRARIMRRLDKLVLEGLDKVTEDIFYVRGLSGEIIVSDRLRKMVERKRLTNIEFVAIEDFKINYEYTY